MRSEQDAQITRSQKCKKPLTLFTRSGGAQQPPGNARLVKQRPQRRSVLLSEHFSRAHHQSLGSRVGDDGEREGGNDGLSRADIAQHHAVHRTLSRHVAADILYRAQLVVRGLERKGGKKAIEARTSRHMSAGRLARHALFLLAHQVQLEHQDLFVDQPSSGLAKLFIRPGEMDGSCRIRSRHKPVTAAKLQGQRIVFAGGCRKGIQNQTANLAAGSFSEAACTATMRPKSTESPSSRRSKNGMVMRLKP